MTRTTTAAAIVLAMACCSEAESTKTDPCSGSPGRITSGGVDKVRYVGTWDTGGVTTATDGSLRLADGVIIKTGVVTTFSAQLVSCEVFEDGCSTLAHVVRELGIQNAYAGHGSADVEPTETPAAVTEVLGATGEQALGSGVMEAGPYCAVHLLIGRFPAIFGVDDPASMSGYSVRITGERPAAGDAKPAVPFVAEGAMAHGEILPFRRAVSVSGPVVVNVQRTLSSAFEGVDWQTMTDKDVARQVVQNLVTHTTVHIKAGD